MIKAKLLLPDIAAVSSNSVPDWDENNPETPGYIKNRTHYRVRTTVFEPVVDSELITFVDEGGEYVAELEGVELETGNYKIRVRGVEGVYECVRFDDTFVINFVRPDDITITYTIGDSFIRLVDVTAGTEFETNLSMSIERDTYEYVKLPSEYIPVDEIKEEIYQGLPVDAGISEVNPSDGLIHLKRGITNTDGEVVNTNEEDIVLGKVAKTNSFLDLDDIQQSDWDENDPTSVSYVKDRTHYYKKIVVAEGNGTYKINASFVSNKYYTKGTRILIHIKDETSVTGFVPYSFIVDDYVTRLKYQQTGTQYIGDAPISDTNGSGVLYKGHFTLTWMNPGIESNLIFTDQTQSYIIQDCYILIPEKVMPNDLSHQFVSHSALFVPNLSDATGYLGQSDYFGIPTELVDYFEIPKVSESISYPTAVRMLSGYGSGSGGSLGFCHPRQMFAMYQGVLYSVGGTNIVIWRYGESYTTQTELVALDETKFTELHAMQILPNGKMLVVGSSKYVAVIDLESDPVSVEYKQISETADDWFQIAAVDENNFAILVAGRNNYLPIKVCRNGEFDDSLNLTPFGTGGTWIVDNDVYFGLQGGISGLGNYDFGVARLRILESNSTWELLFNNGTDTTQGRHQNGCRIPENFEVQDAIGAILCFSSDKGVAISFDNGATWENYEQYIGTSALGEDSPFTFGLEDNLFLKRYGELTQMKSIDRRAKRIYYKYTRSTPNSITRKVTSFISGSSCSLTNHISIGNHYTQYVELDKIGLWKATIGDVVFIDKMSFNIEGTETNGTLSNVFGVLEREIINFQVHFRLRHLPDYSKLEDFLGCRCQVYIDDPEFGVGKQTLELSGGVNKELLQQYPIVGFSFDYKVVADNNQADWDEKNPSSPSYIKNKPIQAQADWEDDSPLSVTHVRNRTHHGVSVIPTGTTAKFDEDGRNLVDCDNSGYIYFNLPSTLLLSTSSEFTMVLSNGEYATFTPTATAVSGSASGVLSGGSTTYSLQWDLSGVSGAPNDETCKLSVVSQTEVPEDYANAEVFLYISLKRLDDVYVNALTDADIDDAIAMLNE